MRDEFGGKRIYEQMYYYLNGIRVAQERDGLFTWMHADHLSSATRITDSSGLEIRRLAYAAFGEEAENQGSDDDPKYTYTGKEHDASGLYYYGARYYDPALSRFITADTMYDVGPQGLNRYSYALNNPIIYRDPTGHQVMEGAIGGTAVCGPPCTVAGALIGLGLGLGIGALIVHNQPVEDVEEGSDVIPLPQIPDDAIPAEPDDEIPGEPEDPKGPPGRRPPFPHSKKGDEEKTLPDWLRERFESGEEFNKANRHRYRYNEVEVTRDGKKYRVDSYNPGKEIVFRRLTQFADVDEKTASRYFNEFAQKYSAGTEITNSPFNPKVIRGSRLSGDLIFEVPVQNKSIPQTVLDAATQRGITIRNVAGKVYN